MKKSIPYFLTMLMLAFITGCVQEGSDQPKIGEVSFSTISLKSFGQGNPSLRISENSNWRHIFKKQVEIRIVHKNSEKEFTLPIDPSDFNKDHKIQLPFGDYHFIVEVKGDKYETYLPFKVQGEFSLQSTHLEVSLEATTDYGLVTVKSDYVNKALIGKDCDMKLTENGEFYYLYIKKGLNPLLKIFQLYHDEPLQEKLEIDAYHHYHYFLKLIEQQGDLSFIELALCPFEYSEDYFEILDQYVQDACGNTYKIVKIGDQYWMASNLKSTKFCNGEDISVEESPYLMEQYLDKNIPVVSFLSPNNYPETGYYSKDAVGDPRNICPCDWHVATDEDWRKLETYLGIPLNTFEDGAWERGVEQNAGGYIKAKDWRDLFEPDRADFNKDANNKIGFTAYPYGEFTYWDTLDPEDPNSPGYWVVMLDGEYGSWWAPASDSYYIREVYDNLLSFSTNPEKTGIRRYPAGEDNSILYNVRCVKD